MAKSFSEGYTPTIVDDKMQLVVPFMSKKVFENNSLSVRIIFDQADSPFIYKNYYKEIKKNADNVYLYTNDIELNSQRKNGEYVLKVLVSGNTVEGEYIENTYDIYISITDGIEDSLQAPSIADVNEAVETPVDNQPDTSATGSETEEVTHQPKVLLAKNSLGNKPLTAGKDYDLSLTFKNYSKAYSMENVKITMTTEYTGIIFETTNWYIDKVGAGGDINLTETITINSKADYGTAPLQFTFEYDDSKGNTFTSTENVLLYINQPAKATFNSDVFPQKVTATKTCKLNCQVENNGLAPIYNVRIYIEGTGLFPTKELYWGTMEAGASNEGELPIYIGMKNMTETGEIKEGKPYGKTTATITLSYEDAEGNVITDTKEYKTVILEPKSSKNKDTKDKTSTQWVNAVYLGSVLLLLLVIIGILSKLIHYKKTYIYKK